MAGDKDVLFQKIGHIWYAFCEVGEKIVYTSLPLGVDPRQTELELFEVIEDHLDQVESLQLNGPYCLIKKCYQGAKR